MGFSFPSEALRENESDTLRYKDRYLLIQTGSHQRLQEAWEKKKEVSNSMCVFIGLLSLHWSHTDNVGLVRKQHNARQTLRKGWPEPHTQTHTHRHVYTQVDEHLSTSGLCGPLCTHTTHMFPLQSAAQLQDVLIDILTCSYLLNSQTVYVRWTWRCNVAYSFSTQHFEALVLAH